MGCGCKGKAQETQSTQTPQQISQNETLAQAQGQKVNTPTIQESIRKVVEKYYKK